MTSSLVHALLLDGQGGAVELTAEQVERWKPSDGQLWLHFDYGQFDSATWIREKLQLPSLACDSLLAGETRPRAVVVEQGSLLFLRGVNLNPEQNPEDMVSIRIYADEHKLISTRKRRLLSVNHLKDNLLSNEGPQSISQVISQLSLGLISRMENVIDNLDEQLDYFECELITEQSSHSHQDLSKIRRQTIALKRYIKPQRDALKQFLSAKHPWFDVAEEQHLNESINHLTRFIEELDMAIERAQIVYEEIANVISEQVNKRMYIMSIVAAIFLPLGFLTGLLGINIGGVPGVDNPYAFTIFVCLLVMLTVGLAGYFRFKKWI